MTLPGSSDRIARDTAPALDEAEVVAYLRRHADFLIRHPELIDRLAPPSRGDGVLDMQTFMIERLRRREARLRANHDALLIAGRRNRATQTQVHGAVLAVLDARSLEHLVAVVNEDFPRLLDADVVSLCVENGADGRTRVRSGIRCLAPGTIATLIEPGRTMAIAVGEAGEAGEDSIFGAGTGLVRAQALIRLDLGARDAPASLLALGWRRDDAVAPGRAGEAFDFLGTALATCLRTWLDRPA